MKFLILTNGATGYKSFFSSIGQALEGKGHEVHCVSDARYATILEPNAFVDARCEYFSDYLRTHYARYREQACKLMKAGATERELTDSWGQFFHADFDRFFWYRTNLKKTSEYWITVALAMRAFFKEQLQRNQIDIVLYENVSNAFAYAAYCAAQQTGARYLGLTAARIPGRFEVQTTIRSESCKVREIYDQLEAETEEERGWIDAYLSNIYDTQPDYMKHNNLDVLSLSGKYFNRRKLTRLLRTIKAEYVLRHDHRWACIYGRPTAVAWSMVRRSIARKFRDPIIRHYFDKRSVNASGQRFYVYPIHFHPESSTSVLAPSFTDELHNITHIASALPLGSLLYVKEHKSAYALQPASFYRKVREIPNVRLLRPEVDIKRLMAQSQGVITVTGTPGFEALMLGKPVYCLGDVFYADLPGVKKADSFAQLAEALASTGRWFQASQRRKALLAYYRYTWPGSLNMMRAASSPGDADVVQVVLPISSVKA